MRAERPHLRLAALTLLWAGCCPPVMAQPLPAWPDMALCEYQTQLEVAPDTGDIRLSRQKVTEEECAEIGAAVAEMPNHWRRRLPPRVRWMQRADTAQLCLQVDSELGQRVSSELGQQGCVFLRPQETCTIVSAAALSHAQLANAVRECAP